MQSVTGVPVVDASSEAPGPDSLSGDRAGTGRMGDRIFGGAATGAGLIVIALVTLIGVFLVSQAIPALAKNEANFFTSTEWSVSGDHPRFGIARLFTVTVLSSLMALCLAVPVGMAVALFITNYAPKWLARPAASTIDLLAAVPSIVFGLWGLRVFGPHTGALQDFFRDNLGWFPLFKKTSVGSFTTIFLAGIVLAIMILPIITALSREVFAQTPSSHKEGALALGATKWEMIRTAVLPFGKPGAISAAMLGLGRALGETVAVMILVSSLAPGSDLTVSLMDGGETFASKIALGAGEFDSPQKTGAYIAAGLVLFILTFIVNAIARMVIERRKAFSE